MLFILCWFETKESSTTGSGRSECQLFTSGCDWRKWARRVLKEIKLNEFSRTFAVKTTWCFKDDICTSLGRLFFYLPFGLCSNRVQPNNSIAYFKRCLIYRTFWSNFYFKGNVNTQEVVVKTCTQTLYIPLQSINLSVATTRVKKTRLGVA